MSAKNFYQTFYQSDPLFRLAGELWGAETATAAPTQEPTPTEDNSLDLLTELDTLSAGTGAAVETDALLANTVQPKPILLPATPEPVVLITSPEPLPQPAPRPTIPSILPPIQQQTRMPQLNHKVLLLADEELDPSNLLFLEKILKAVNLNINGVDLLNLHGAKDMNFGELLSGKYINHFITFGVPFERINLDIMMDRYSPVSVRGHNVSNGRLTAYYRS